MGHEKGPEPLRICLVCTGNTCRSPMAEGILRDLASARNLDGWHVESGGLYALEGAPATKFAVEAAREHGVDISGHRARRFDIGRARRCNLVLVHSGEHLHEIVRWDARVAGRTFLLKHFPRPDDPGPRAWVADPIGLDLESYRATFLELDEVLRRIVPQIQAWAGEEL